MDVSKSISYDSTYSKSQLTDRKIEQSIPQIKNDGNLGQKVERLDNLDTKDELESIKDAIEKANRKLNLFDRKLDISVHAKTGRVMVKVIDTVKDMVIREIPPEKVLDSAASVKEMLGFMLDKKI